MHVPPLVYKSRCRIKSCQLSPTPIEKAHSQPRAHEDLPSLISRLTCAHARPEPAQPQGPSPLPRVSLFSSFIPRAVKSNPIYYCCFLISPIGLIIRIMTVKGRWWGAGEKRGENIILESTSYGQSCSWFLKVPFSFQKPACSHRSIFCLFQLL